LRIYIDESGTHGDSWLVIGMLFVPDHGPLHSNLCNVKEKHKYFNGRVDRNARYKETHFAEFKKNRDALVAKEWVDRFVASSATFRSVVIDWSVYQGKFFGDPFEPEALKKRRAYKKWAEMLLQPEAVKMHGARLYLDRLRVMYGYDVLDHLRERFTSEYLGSQPRIAEFQPVDSWKDAHQCLQLCDLLTGAIYRKLVPATRPVKQEVVDYLYQALIPHGVKQREIGYWKQYADANLAEHFPKFSEWYWRPKK
jgi:hypothetical protein